MPFKVRLFLTNAKIIYYHNKLITRGGEQPVDLSEHAELIFDSEAVKSDGASRRVQHFVSRLLEMTSDTLKVFV